MTPTEPDRPPVQGVRQLRLVVHASDFDEAVTFYRDTLGLAVELDLESEGSARVVILDAGRATLEISNSAQVAHIDAVEVGRAVSPHLRVAFEVSDVAVTTDRLVGGGADLIAAPTRTPWDSLNSRLAAPGDLQLTLFEELG
ncbi:MAG: VOC family protein [Nocardioidaceae bacterium]